MRPIVLRNGSQSVTFVPVEGGYRPEWFRLDRRVMLRFKDHEFLNVSGLRVTTGSCRDHSDTHAEFGGCVRLGSQDVDWTVRVSVPGDGQGGFVVNTFFAPRHEPIEIIEGLSTFETPYEYDVDWHIQTFLAQQPVYWFQGGKELCGAGFMTPLWYYGRTGRAHLTYPCASPLAISHVSAADGSNARFTMVLGNWNQCGMKDMFIQPTRDWLADEKAVFADDTLAEGAGRHGMKFLIGACNWNNSMHKDPNVLVEPAGLRQEVIVHFLNELPEGIDGFLIEGWQRICRLHFPVDGVVPAYEVAKSRGASWVGAADWICEQFQKPEGMPGFYNPQEGTVVYSPFTRPRWDNGVKFFAGQFLGPLAMAAHVWKDRAILESIPHMEELFASDKQQGHSAEAIWTIGPTPMYVSVLRKAGLLGLSPACLEHVENYVRRHSEILVEEPDKFPKVDEGQKAWDALMNLLAVDILDRQRSESNARALLERVNAALDGKWWTFNCSVVGNLVGAGNARPFGHSVAASANLQAYRHFGDEKYLAAARRFADIYVSMHVMTFNESPTADMDTRGWCQGSTGGRDQIAQMPPWETGHSLQHLAPFLIEGVARDAYYDALWLHAHTGLAAYPKARTLKRVYRPDMSVTYRPVDEMSTERDFYLSLPYLAYENPWDQTMLAGYQGVEGILLSLFLGGGMVACEDDRVAALVPEAAWYVQEIDKKFTAHLWNPLDRPVMTRLFARVAQRQGRPFTMSGGTSGKVSRENPWSDSVTVPPRQVMKVVFTAE